MKTFAISLLIGLGLLTAEAKAAGPYDGIWAVSYFGLPVGYYSAHERDGTLIAVQLPDGNASWEAYWGPRNGNTVNMSTLVSGVNAQLTVTFTSDITFNATQISCVPVVAGWHCLYPNGATVQGYKVW